MSAKASKRMQRVVKGLRECVTKRPPDFEEIFNEINDGLASGDLPGLDKAAFRLGILSVYYGRRGAIRVLDGDLGGWEEIHRSAAYRLWNLRVSFGEFTDFPRPLGGWPIFSRSAIPHAALLYCHYAAKGSEAEWRFARNLLAILTRHTEVADEYLWGRLVFELFVLRLAEKEEPFEVPKVIEGRGLGPYAKLLDYWDAPERLGPVIEELCEYHCDNIRDVGEHTPPFVNGIFETLPSEIQAIYAIRRRLGLETPPVDHPLLATPLADFHGEPDYPGDDVLTRVREACKTFFKPKTFDAIERALILEYPPALPPTSKKAAPPRPPAGSKAIVRFVRHLTPFAFEKVDTFSILDQPLAEMKTPIPFSESAVEVTEELVDVDQWLAKADVVPDEIHIFTPPGGTDGKLTERQFYFLQGVLKSTKIGMDPNYVDRLVQETIAKR